jgi:addiction module HigA family antidote
MAGKRLEPIHPGEILFEEFMNPLGISMNRLARDLDVPPARIHGIVHGDRAISADTALRLYRYFGVEAEFWMRLQSDFDLRIAKQSIFRSIEQSVKPRKAA